MAESLYIVTLDVGERNFSGDHVGSTTGLTHGRERANFDYYMQNGSIMYERIVQIRINTYNYIKIRKYT